MTNAEEPIKFIKTDLAWLFSADLTKEIKEEEFDKVKKRVYDCSFCEGSLKYYTPNEKDPEKPIGAVDIKNNDSREEYEKLLNLLMKREKITFNDDYLEGENYTRFILKKIKIKLPKMTNFQECKVLLTISKLGIVAFSFWITIESELNSKEITEIELIPLLDQKISVKLPIEVLKEVGKFNIDASEVSKEFKEPYFPIQNISFGAIFNLYWLSILNTVWGYKYKSKEEILGDLRYEPYTVFPFVAIHSTDKEYRFCDDLIKNHKKQIIQILMNMLNVDYELIRPESLYQDIGPNSDQIYHANISSRKDLAYLNSLGAILMIFGSEKFEDFMEQELDGFLIAEVLLIEREFFGVITKYLSMPISKVKPRTLASIRSYLSKALDYYYGNITGNSLARRRLEHGEEILEIRENFKLVEKKIELVGEALDSYANSQTIALQLAIALILGIVGTLKLPFNDFVNFFISLGGIFLLITLIYYGFEWRWRRVRGKSL
jgi:hypothetical protein